MVKILAWMILLSISIHGPIATAQPSDALRADLVGTWSWTVPNGKCTETHTYRADGTRFVVSGAEKSDSTYLIEQVPNSRFRKLTITTTKDYGGKDCGESEENDEGRTSSVFYLLIQDRGQVLFCYEPSPQECYGPFRKGSGT